MVPCDEVADILCTPQVEKPVISRDEAREWGDVESDREIEEKKKTEKKARHTGTIWAPMCSG